MEQQYQWAVRVTTEFLDADGSVAQTDIEVRYAVSEREAIARHEAIVDTIANPHFRRNFRRIGAVELIRRPYGEWEVVA